MKKLKFFLFPAAMMVLVLALLTGCTAGGGGLKSANSIPADTYTDEDIPYSAGNDGEKTEDAYTDGDDGPEAGSGANLAGTPSLTVPQDGRKVILNAYLSIEAIDFASTCKVIQEATANSGGYISAADLYTFETDRGFRTANYTVKVPADAYADFMNEMGEAGNVTSRNETSEDVTRQYVDVEARLRALRAQETRLLELMEQSASLKDLLTVQEELAGVQYQIEDYMAARNTYDHLVAYSTVSIDVYEVSEVSEVPPEQYGERIGTAFRESWKIFASFFQEFSIGFVFILPGLIVVAVIVVLVLLILRRVTKKRANKEPAASATPPANPYATWPVATPQSPMAPPLDVGKVEKSNIKQKDEPPEKESK